MLQRHVSTYKVIINRLSQEEPWSFVYNVATLIWDHRRLTMCVVIRNMYIDWSVMNELLHLCLELGLQARNVCWRVTLGRCSLIRFLVTPLWLY